MEESARLDKLENAIRKTQDSMLLMGKDMHQINQSVSSVAKSMEALVKVQQDVRIMEERNETRHQQLREADRLLHKRIDALASLSTKASNGDRAYSILVQIGKWTGAGVVILMLGLLVFLIELKGYIG